MRERIISFLKMHPIIMGIIWGMSRCVLRTWGWFVPIQSKTMIFSSFGGRGFNDSPKALYDEICSRKEFDDWKLIWAFVNPKDFEIPRGEKIQIDTPTFFRALLYSRVWISNSGMDRGIGLRRKRKISIETWHGTPLKKICGEEHQTSVEKNPISYKGPIDEETIRCAQSKFDREIFARIFHANIESILLSDLPRNDELLKYKPERLNAIRKRLGIEQNKKIILYTPTYREYLINEAYQNFIVPPMDLIKWERELGNKYVLLIRAHYAVAVALEIKDSDFVKDVSNYPSINDLYVISDMMISDYSSTYFDFAILDRPVFCFAYDLDEYEEKRGLYLKLSDVLPCEIDSNEDSLIRRIKNLDNEEASNKTQKFHQRFAPNAGNASKVVIDKLCERLFLHQKK